MRRIMAIFLCVLLITAVLVSGCKKTAQKPVPETSPISGVEQTSDSEKRIMASNFSNLAMSVNGVQKATVVVSSTVTANPQDVNGDPNSVPGLSPSNNGTTYKPDTGSTNEPGSDMSGLNSLSGEIPNVTSGRLVVMVGLNLKDAAMKDKNMENTIKEEVKTKIMQSDQKVNEVLVTTNPDMIKKLQDVAAGVIQGQPIQSYAQQINELDKGIRTNQ